MGFIRVEEGVDFFDIKGDLEMILRFAGESDFQFYALQQSDFASGAGRRSDVMVGNR